MRRNRRSGWWFPAVWTAQTGQLTTTATLTQVGTYAAGSLDYMVERMSSLRGAQTNLFTRSIGYSYAFELPPGRGGLTPVLGLNYTSSSHTPGSGHARFSGLRVAITGADAIYIAPGDTNTFKPTLSLQGGVLTAPDGIRQSVRRVVRQREPVLADHDR